MFWNTFTNHCESVSYDDEKPTFAYNTYCPILPLAQLSTTEIP